jgi:hypothetical protein
MRRSTLLVAVAIAGIAWVLLSSDRWHEGTDPLERVAAPDLQVLDVAQVIEYSEMSAPTYRIRTTRDVLPGGVSAAMAPALVAWNESDFVEGGEIIVRNVNHGGNPLSGVTVLRTATIRPEYVARAELVMVPLGGPDAVSHGQVRFVFDAGGAEFWGGDPAIVGEPDPLDELVLSWEAWRPPGVDYSVLKGMDPEVYQLSMRAYSGVQRFLEDSLQRRAWNVYTLQLPGGREGAAELLRVSLAMGDGAGRHVLSQMLGRAEGEWVSTGPDGHPQEADARALWQQIEANLGGARTGGDERIEMAGRTGYQTMLRSCATMALYSINVATARLIERGYLHEGQGLARSSDITGEPEWMRGLANESILGLFLQGPRALAFVRNNPTTIPGNIPGALDEAGLLVRNGGNAVKLHFEIEGQTPWGPAETLLIR